ncbi:MAG: GNAT family N-acetyltransferase [Clostridia bacterium]|nr:GNAT family N-acetyltransferase [Clostridia bacterium]
MEDDIVLRPMEQTDKEAVAAFFDSMDETGKRFFDIGGANRKVTMRFFDGSDTEPRKRFAAFLGKEMIGYVYLKETNRKIPWLGIAVSPKARGKHLGKRLMDYAAGWAEERGYGGILLTTHKENEAGQRLYEKCGYEKLGVFSANGEYLYLLRFPRD